MLILDRTNWMWGQRDLNLLILSVMWKSFSFPLAWTALPHGGSSSSAARIALLESVVATLHGKRLTLLADREFIGQDWFLALQRLGINRAIRLQATTRVNGIEVRACFQKLQPGEWCRWHCAITVYGVRMQVLVGKNLHGEILCLDLADHGWSTQAIDRYAWRWNAENMPQALKGRGFDLEATRLTDGDRLSLLFGVVALAFIWCCVSGDFVATKSPPKTLKHGYSAKSVFRLGLDALGVVLSKRPRHKHVSRPTFLQLLATLDP